MKSKLYSIITVSAIYHFTIIKPLSKPSRLCFRIIFCYISFIFIYMLNVLSRFSLILIISNVKKGAGHCIYLCPAPFSIKNCFTAVYYAPAPLPEQTVPLFLSQARNFRSVLPASGHCPFQWQQHPPESILLHFQWSRRRSA